MSQNSELQAYAEHAMPLTSLFPMAMHVEPTLCLVGSSGSTISATSDAQQPEPVRIAKPV